MESVLFPEDPSQFPGELHAPRLALADIVLGIKTQPIVVSQTSTSESAHLQPNEAADIQSPDEHSTLRESSSILNEFRRVFQDFICKDLPRTKKTVVKDSSNPSKIDRPQESEVVDTGCEEDRNAALDVARPESRIGQSCLIDATSMVDSEHISIEAVHQMQHETIAGVLGLVASQRSQADLAEEIYVSKELVLTEEAVDLGLTDIITQA